MSGIQILLISGVVGMALYYTLRLRSAFIDLVLLSMFAGLAIFFILSPNYTSAIAHKVGVGRGADMLFYICILFFLFTTLKLFSRVRRLEQTLTELVRQQAKSEAHYLENNEEAPGAKTIQQQPAK